MVARVVGSPRRDGFSPAGIGTGGWRGGEALGCRTVDLTLRRLGQVLPGQPKGESIRVLRTDKSCSAGPGKTCF